MTIINHYIKMHRIFRNASSYLTINNMQEALQFVKRYRIKSEIIGEWLYCFTMPYIGLAIDELGFWFSYTHGAFIYSGGEREGEPDLESLDEIRQRLGHRKIS
jgi:hypothetical protein